MCGKRQALDSDNLPFVSPASPTILASGQKGSIETCFQYSVLNSQDFPCPAFPVTCKREGHLQRSFPGMACCWTNSFLCFRATRYFLISWPKFWSGQRLKPELVSNSGRGHALLTYKFGYEGKKGRPGWFLFLDEERNASDSLNLGVPKRMVISCIRLHARLARGSSLL